MDQSINIRSYLTLLTMHFHSVKSLLQTNWKLKNQSISFCSCLSLFTMHFRSF